MKSYFTTIELNDTTLVIRPDLVFDECDIEISSVDNGKLCKITYNREQLLFLIERLQDTLYVMQKTKKS
jgi:hypothetical protein